MPAHREPITVMADGTVKQINPLSGTEVWTVPGRGHRPLVAGRASHMAEGPRGRGVPCAFCLERADEVPPEKARVVRSRGVTGATGAEEGGFVTLTAVPPEELHSTTPEFRRLPNLFEIVSYEYWRENHGLTPIAEARANHDRWLASPRGRELVLGVLRARFLSAGGSSETWGALDDDARLARSMAFFAGGHDLVVPRRHVTDDDPEALASSATLTPSEHTAYVRFTVASIERLYADIPAARYVAAFQNWLAPAGASFDHLHKQLVAIDEHGDQVQRELTRLTARSGLYAGHLQYARDQGLVIAENDHAVAFAGFGHRYPTLEVWAKDTDRRPFEMTRTQIDGVSDVLHALHVATGSDIPCNEEWHHRPADVDRAMPWRIELKWRISTLAGFEGGTRIFVTTLTPWALRDRALETLVAAQRDGRLAAGLRLART